MARRRFLKNWFQVFLDGKMDFYGMMKLILGIEKFILRKTRLVLRITKFILKIVGWVFGSIQTNFREIWMKKNHFDGINCALESISMRLYTQTTNVNNIFRVWIIFTEHVCLKLRLTFTYQLFEHWKLQITAVPKCKLIWTVWAKRMTNENIQVKQKRKREIDITEKTNFWG